VVTGKTDCKILIFESSVNFLDRRSGRCYGCGIAVVAWEERPLDFRQIVAGRRSLPQSSGFAGARPSPRRRSSELSFRLRNSTEAGWRSFAYPSGVPAVSRSRTVMAGARTFPYTGQINTVFALRFDLRDSLPAERKSASCGREDSTTKRPAMSTTGVET